MTKEIKKETANGTYEPIFMCPCLLRKNDTSVMVKLLMMGYEPEYQTFQYNLQGNNIVCEYDTFHATDSDNKPHCIDCGTNVEMFLELAALKTASYSAVDKKEVIETILSKYR